MLRLFNVAARVATVDSTVLITGETGVGKERLARWLHESSPRAGRRFLAVNCGAFAEQLLESELFGYARGAFTGALNERAGLIEAADRGTLFLDEIGETSPAMQTRLLRVVQEREIRRLGENGVRTVNVRIVAATNRELEREVAEHRFRADLWYRLRVIELRIPPLRERPEDVRTIALDLLHRVSARLQRSVSGFTPRAMERIAAYAWPGNVRELEHAVEHACALADHAEIDLEDLPDAVRGPAVPPEAVRDILGDREREYIRAVVQRHHGRRRLAADELGISLSTLNRRLRGPS
jgi:transcriptional regulator with PAS, ATPase and Fis domain